MTSKDPIKNPWSLVEEQMNASSQGMLIVLSGPSGAGKDTVIRILKGRHTKLHYGVTYTTRLSRKGEVDWENYHFVSEEEFFEVRDEGGFIEWVEYNGNYYGTPKEQIKRALEEGRNVILKIEVRGAVKIKKMYPEAIFIFITTPTREELADRLKQRKTDLSSSQKERLEIAEKELEHILGYDYLIINHNDQALAAAEKVWSIIVAERCRVGEHGVKIK